MLAVGIPKEIKPQEKRVGLTPQAAGDLTRQGIRVIVEAGAGRESGFPDADYQAQGAEITAGRKSLYERAGLIQKVKEPLPEEAGYLKRDQILFCFLHLASPENCKLVKALRQAGVTAIGYETVEKDEKFPILAPMSEIAGGLAAIYSAYFFRSPEIYPQFVTYPPDFFKGLSLLAERYPASPGGSFQGRVIIYGGGVAGIRALELSLQMGGKVTLAERKEKHAEILARTEKKYHDHLRMADLSESLDQDLSRADVLIGCAHHRSERAPKVMEEAALRVISRNKKKIIMDVAIDQGGNFPESHPTAYDNPLYADSYGNLRFCVANIPSLCGKAASVQVSEKTSRYTLAMAKDFDAALKQFPELKHAVNIRQGEVIHPAVLKAHSL